MEPTPRSALMKTNTPLSLFVLLCVAAASHGQGTIRITFEGPPPQPPGTDFAVTNYLESGMRFVPIPPSYDFGRSGSNQAPYWADDGSTYLEAGFGNSLRFSFTNGAPFGLVAVDLAEWNTD